jgi:hypothetical protein
MKIKYFNRSVEIENGLITFAKQRNGWTCYETGDLLGFMLVFIFGSFGIVVFILWLSLVMGWI